jgi:predicted deacylase
MGISARASYNYYSYGDAAKLLLDLASQRPDLASLSTTQALYGLRSAGTCASADGTRSACLTHVLEITNRSSAAAEPERPEVLISGALHGDEQVGPLTALELSVWLLSRYDTDAWVRRLVDTRRILIVPMTNAIGVATNQRSELGIDPNRDFPFDQEPGRCMQTIAARSVNELYRAHLLQLAITFHGGMQARHTARPPRHARRSARAPLAAHAAPRDRPSRTTGAPSRTTAASRTARPTTTCSARCRCR